jgi:F0F1-type ATP synthase membrane subunit b/b'
MSDFTISNLIKIILGVVVFVIVVAALFFFFKEKFIDFFKNFLS